MKSIVKSQRYPRTSMAAIWSILAEYHRDDLPNIIKVATLALTHPVHTADCERSFSSQNQVTTPLRNRISPDNCQKLMRVMIEGPPLKCQRSKKEKKDVAEFDFVAALVEWIGVSFNHQTLRQFEFRVSDWCFTSLSTIFQLYHDGGWRYSVSEGGGDLRRDMRSGFKCCQH